MAPDRTIFKNYGVHTIKPQLRPWWIYMKYIVKNYSAQILFARLCIIIIIIIINYIVSIKGPRRGRELHVKQILIQCTYNNTTFLCRTESETK